jgi:hypothetical protein
MVTWARPAARPAASSILSPGPDPPLVNRARRRRRSHPRTSIFVASLPMLFLFIGFAGSRTRGGRAFAIGTELGYCHDSDTRPRAPGHGEHGAHAICYAIGRPSHRTLCELQPGTRRMVTRLCRPGRVSPPVLPRVPFRRTWHAVSLGNPRGASAGMHIALGDRWRTRMKLGLEAVQARHGMRGRGWTSRGLAPLELATAVTGRRRSDNCTVAPRKESSSWLGTQR